MFLKFVAPYLLFVFYTVLRWTWRIEIRESEGLKQLLKDRAPFVVAHWHGEELGLLFLLARYHVGCMVSLSTDGALIGKIIELSGSRVVRGSSSRGAVQALKGILRLAKDGWRPSVAVDGPRGPLYQVKPGVVEIARVIKAPIVSINMASSNPQIFKKSWNKSELPRPFSKLVVTWGEPIEFSGTEIEPFLPQVARSLHQGRRECLLAVGRPAPQLD